MKLFIWTDVQKLTTSWHHNGGLIVIAETLERARQLIGSTAAEGCDALTVEPDIVRECEGPELIEIHPNAGCC